MFNMAMRRLSLQFLAVIAIPEGAVIEGSIRTAKLKLVQAWIEIHQDELMANWTLAISGQQVFKIEPLK
jgi:Domain of unknown function (DUF4160)